ncbi:MAG TPA: hypothetical protein VK167_13010 [Flavipsychrobacter sp.]|nr:hypothetical protein [Flavipsychrobacter sp.]
MKHLALLLLFIPMLSFAQSKDELFLRDSALLAKELRQMRNVRYEYEQIGDFTVKHLPNMLRLIQIINKYGYPSINRYGFKGNVELVILQTPRLYADTILTLLEAEKQAGRVGHYEYAYLCWRLNRTVVLPTFGKPTNIKIQYKKQPLHTRNRSWQP